MTHEFLYPSTFPTCTGIHAQTRMRRVAIWISTQSLFDWFTRRRGGRRLVRRRRGKHPWAMTHMQNSVAVHVISAPFCTAKVRNTLSIINLQEVRPGHGTDQPKADALATALMALAFRIRSHLPYIANLY